ncbi:DUF4429 domain-containing protein [Streptomyces sp. NPDC051561]|uniref:DUF4429 domain-containing protein n=1 Tax=Streptomyces sp. NPDC051561 TaxID=3365658 RepID=UPI00379B9B00
MAEILQKDGTWTFDGDTVRIVPGRGRVHPLRQALGELEVPLTALAGIAFEPGRKGGGLRLRLREGACPLLLAAGGRLPDNADPYRLAVESDRTGVAEYFADEVRNALLLDRVPAGPVDHFLLPGPSVPVSIGGADGTASFDGESVQLTWSWKAEEAKSDRGPLTLPLAAITGVDWLPAIGLENGHLRFLTATRGGAKRPAVKYDPHALTLWGLSRKEYAAALVAAAVLARRPHPLAPADTPALEKAAPEPVAVPAPPAPPDQDHDVLLRRLRELGELHRAGILDDEEFARAKQAVLKQL